MRTRPRTLACPIEVRFDAGNDNCMGGKGVVEDINMGFSILKIFPKIFPKRVRGDLGNFEFF